MKVDAIIQARMSSTRLPGKVMKTLIDRPVLQHLIERLAYSKNLSKAIIATTDNAEDDCIADLTEKLGVLIFRGSKSNVLERYYFAATKYKCEHIVRITSDCPLFDPYLLDDMIAFYRKELNSGRKIDYLSNSIHRTYPRGLDAEIFSYKTMKFVYDGADKAYEKEHVTPYIYTHPELFEIKEFFRIEDYSDYRWTLDTIEDWDMIQKIYSSLYHQGALFTTDKIIQFLKAHPDIAEINSHIEQKHFTRVE